MLKLYLYFFFKKFNSKLTHVVIDDYDAKVISKFNRAQKM